MKAKFLMTAAAFAIVAGSANAQVVSALADIAEEYGGVFANVSINYGGINGSVDIVAGGANGGTANNILEGSTDLSTSFTDVDINGSAAASGTEDALDVSDVTLGPVAGIACDTNGAGDGSSAADCQFSGSATFTNLVETMSDTSTTTQATTATFGNVATLAAGAVNSTTTDIIETGSVTNSFSDAFTSDTGSSASFDQTIGSGVIVISGATNLPDIDGSVSVNVIAGNVNGGDIGTTVVGATSTADISAEFVGALAGDI
ncbi:hypothetical protein HKCCSP123_16985 [Rhodobacterales bacterium HKCCSP123]|nr:hypothetical protein [Rhodobacterales bacterium HKCCSP123]